MEKCRNTKVFCASPIFMSHKHRIITHKYCIIANPLVAIGVCFVAHFVGVRNQFTECSQPILWVDATISQNVRNPFCGWTQPIHGMFVTH
ncbi:MAG: hypothetical protein HXN58_08250 [Prevotella pallens]|uniref:hypothetical protein n=1 Tax=Prevotella pallens TaxID=60133 RepID=UPI001CB03932|nr:hypothetical protein [Prevotella pallens]MBF1443699.1 hypothetical protein [Prevotella pallens]